MGSGVEDSLAIESRLQYMTLNPVVAWKIAPPLSVATGPTLNYSKLMFRRGLVTTTDQFKFEGDDISLWLQCRTCSGSPCLNGLSE